MPLSTLKYENLDYELSYLFANQEGQKDLLILHGWGANKELMQTAFKDTFKEYRHIYVDLCGFGKSNSPKIMTSEDYAEILSLFLQQKNIKPNIIMGHSFGGKIASLLSLKFDIALLILLSSAGIVLPKRFWVRCKIFCFKLCKFIGLGKFRKFFASKDAATLNPTMYETFKRVVNEDFSGIFKQLSCKSVLFWGQDDSATPLKSGEIMHSLIKKSEFFVLKGDHFFFLKQGKEIEKTSKNFLKADDE